MKKLKVLFRNKKAHVEVEKVPDENEIVLDWKWKMPVKNPAWSLEGISFIGGS